MIQMRRIALVSLLFAVSLGITQVIPAHAYYVWQWDGLTKVTLGERSVQGPAVAYDPSIGKTIMTWIGIDCCGHSLNLISSSDMMTWSNKVTLPLSASAAAACTDSLDAVYDPDNSRVYVAYLHVDLFSLGACDTNYVYVFYTSDGTTISSLSLVTKTQYCQPSCGGDNQMSGPSITYDTINHRFVVAAMVNQNIGGTIYHKYFTYTSTDGLTWAGGQQVLVNPGPSAIRPEIRFINGQYYLTYMASNGYVTIAKSSDLNTWTTISNTIQQTGTTPRLSLNPSENLYHLSWRGTDSSNQINDALSYDGAVTWPSKSVFESTQDEPSLTWNSASNSLLLAWTGTDCCIGGSLNVEQYHQVWIGGGGGGGSVAQGTLITMANGSNVPVQNLKVGDKMLGYDTVHHQYTVSEVKSITVVTTSNMLVIHTASGTPFRVDANPAQTLWTKRPDNSILWLPVTRIQQGDLLFTQNGWTSVTGVEFAPAGTHVMYDIVATSPYFASGYLDPIFKL